MHCAIYKSVKKSSSYLYINKKDDFKDLPESLLAVFGEPQFLMLINLSKRKTLAQADIETVRASLKKTGFYLQLPPTLDTTLKHITLQNTKL